MKLCLFRHGIAIDRADPSCPSEFDRMLTPVGIDRTRAAALGIKKLGFTPDLVLSSPLVRAVETARIAMEVIGLDEPALRTTEALSPMGSPEAFIDELTRLRTSNVLCTGHRPNMDELLALAFGISHRTFTAIKKAGAALIELDPERPSGELLWLLQPKTLRLLGKRV